MLCSLAAVFDVGKKREKKKKKIANRLGLEKTTRSKLTRSIHPPLQQQSNRSVIDFMILHFGGRTVWPATN